MSHIGAMNEQIIIQSDTKTKNSQTGEVVKTYTDLKTIWAAKVGEIGNETVKNDKLSLQSVLRFTIRYDSTLKTSYQAKYRDEVYKIIGLKEIDRKRYQEIELQKYS